MAAFRTEPTWYALYPVSHPCMCTFVGNAIASHYLLVRSMLYIYRFWLIALAPV